MFIAKPQTAPLELDEAINTALAQLDYVPAYSEEYAKIVNQITALTALKTTTSPPRVSPDTLALVLGNLLGIVIIVGHERAGIVTSKALSFVLKASR